MEGLLIYVRAKSPAGRLIFGPYASALAGEVAAEYIKKKAVIAGLQ